MCPNSPSYYNNRAAAFIMLDKYQQGLKDVQRALLIDNTLIKVYLHRTVFRDLIRYFNTGFDNSFLATNRAGLLKSWKIQCLIFFIRTTISQKNSDFIPTWGWHVVKYVLILWCQCTNVSPKMHLRAETLAVGDKTLQMLDTKLLRDYQIVLTSVNSKTIQSVSSSATENLDSTWSVVAERSSLPDSSSGVSNRMWVRISAVTRVSLSKTLNHNCFSPPRG